MHSNYYAVALLYADCPGRTSFPVGLIGKAGFRLYSFCRQIRRMYGEIL